MYRRNTWAWSGSTLHDQAARGVSKSHAAFRLEELAKASIALRSRRLFGHIVTYGWRRRAWAARDPAALA